MESSSRHQQRPARLIPIIRTQSEIREICLDDMLPNDHRARLLWQFAEDLDLTRSLSRIKSREGEAGRPAHDPRMLLSLWLYATSQGIGSARRVAELCQTDVAYRWLSGDVHPNYHALSDFRSQGGKQLDDLMRQLLTGLVSNHILTLRRVSQDGVKVRAHAGAASFRREPSLKEIEARVKRQIEDLKKELDADPGASSRREQAARERSLKEKADKVARALRAVREVQETIDRNLSPSGREREARASTTDPEARVMHMADNGFRPATNIQFATDTKTRLVVGVEANNRGTDAGSMEAMVRQVEVNTGVIPQELLVDGGYVSHKDMQAVAEMGVSVLAPLPKSAKGRRDPSIPRKGDTVETAAWRIRMARPENQDAYKERAATSETVHADLRSHRGLRQMPVRGLDRIQSVALLMALTYNALRVIANGWM